MLGHGGEIGRAREQALRDLLGSFLPPALAISTGFVIDAHGGRSRQLDIIVHFADYHAVFNVGGVPLVPVEAVIAVLEVKSDAAAKSVLHACYDNLASVKCLDRSNGGRNVYLIDRHPQHLQAKDWRNFQFQVFAGVVAIRSPTQDHWLDATLEWCSGRDRAQWPNFFCGIDDFIGAYNVPHDGFLYGGPEPPTALELAAWAPSEETPLAWAVQEVLNFIRVAKRVDYLPTSYFTDGERPSHTIKTRPLP